MYVIQWDSKNGSSGSSWSTNSYCNDKEVLFYTWSCVCLNSCGIFACHVINNFINLSAKLENKIVNLIQVLVLGRNQHILIWHWELSWIERFAKKFISLYWIGYAWESYNYSNELFSNLEVFELQIVFMEFWELLTIYITSPALSSTSVNLCIINICSK